MAGAPTVIVAPVLHTARLVLRPWAEDDLDAYAEIVAEVCRFLGHPPMGREDAWPCRLFGQPAPGPGPA